MNSDISQTLKDFFVEHLPITQFMGLEVDSYDGEQLILQAPLEPNINDKQTAFGGSLYNAAVMACWGLVYLKTQEKGIQCNQVVTGGEVKYKAPVAGTIRAIAQAPDAAEFDRFFADYAETGKARISLDAIITTDGQPGSKIAVTFSGNYAIISG
ncbi:YiiD C-terminal domain-containing protein [Bacterioplanoides sp.]|uniref:YiiD C-terminal domain-containing protein n=1 Tax=Bacterioplanoides sp. TaxID=2066072 RepID=UPI003B003FD1